MDQIGPYDFREGPKNNIISWKERFSLALTLLAIPGYAIVWLCSYLLKRGPKLSFSQEMMVKAGGYTTKTLTLKQLRILVPIIPLRVQLNKFRATAQIAGLKNYNYYFGGQTYSARWIHECPDRTPHDPVIVLLHGGGYALKVADPINTTWIWFASQFKGLRVSFLALDYTVTPFVKFPGQLGELCDLLRDLARTCSRISFMGDSCGAHLGLTYLVHSVHPYDTVASIDVPIESFMAFSPWTGIDAHAPYPSLHFEDDMIDIASLEEMQQLFCDAEHLKSRRANFVLETSKELWQKVLPLKTAITWGFNEVLRDSIRDWVRYAEVEHTFEENPGYHDSLVLGHNLPSTAFIAAKMHDWFAIV